MEPMRPPRTNGGLGQRSALMRWYSLKGVPRGSKNGSGASIGTRAEAATDAFLGWSRQGPKSLALVAGSWQRGGAAHADQPDRAD